jgi:hypothetical protein
MSPHRPLFRRSVLLTVAGFALAIVAVLAVPDWSGNQPVHRPAQPTVQAAIARNAVHKIRGRIASVTSEGFTVRMLLGSKKVVELSNTVYIGRQGKSLSESKVHRGDKVVVLGYVSGDELLGISVIDSSRK